MGTKAASGSKGVDQTEWGWGGDGVGPRVRKRGKLDDGGGTAFVLSSCSHTKRVGEKVQGILDFCWNFILHNKIL